MPVGISRYTVLLALLLPACAAQRAATEALPRPVHLSAGDIANMAALLRMEDLRQLDTALVARLLDDPQAEVRGRAALAAGRVKDPAATPLLLRALAADADVEVRARAAFALGVLGDTSARVLDALAARAAADAHGAVAAAQEALFAMGQLGRPAARAALHAALEPRNEVPAPLRQEALLALWRLPADTQSIRLMTHWLGDSAPETRWRAALALWRGGSGVRAITPLLAAAGDTDDRVRANAVRGLRAAAADSAGLRAAALDALIAAAMDPHPHVRINAVRMLPQYRDMGRTTPVLAGRLLDEDANVASAAAEALGQAGDRAAMAALAGIAHSGARPDGLRAAALAALARIDPAAAVTLAASWADSARWTLRLYAATTGASAGAAAAAAAPVLERLARDSHPVVATRALAALGQLADTVPAVRRVLIEQLASPDPIVRAAATTALGRTAGPAELDLLLLAYQRSLQDTAPDAATAAVSALGRLIRAGVPADRAFFARFAQQPPGSMAVYEAIARYIGPPPAAWTPPPARPELRPLAFYQEIVARFVAPALAGEPLPRVAIGTIHGDVVIELFAADAPLTVHNFLALVERGYYTGTRWHRVVPGFVLQDGDPRGDGSGGPGYTIRDELNRHRYHRGTVGMALSGPDTGGSQFFITHAPQPHLDAGYTVFGRVVAGMAAADRVVQDEPIHGFRRLR